MSYRRPALVRRSIVLLLASGGLLLSNISGVRSADTPGELLTGKVAASPRWGSGWIDLTKPINLAAGDRLRLRLGGTATKVLLRLLGEGQFPDDPVGILGGPLAVPKERLVEVKVESARRGIVQISVHGGPNPWGQYPLGEKNGPATLESAELLKHSTPPR